MSCSTEVYYISIYERRGTRGRPRGSKYTDEQKRNLRKAALRHYYNNYEYCTLQQQLSKKNARQVKKEANTIKIVDYMLLPISGVGLFIFI